MTDRFSVRTVVVGLALAVLFGLVIMGWLASTQTPIPDALDRLVFMLAGGFVGVLASTRSDGAPQDVNVTNTAADPVPTSEAGMSEIGLVLLTVIAVLVVLVAVGALQVDL